MSQGDRDESIPPTPATQLLSLNNATPPTDDDSVDNGLQRQNAFRFMGRAPTAPAAIGPRGEILPGKKRKLGQSS